MAKPEITFENDPQVARLRKWVKEQFEKGLTPDQIFHDIYTEQNTILPIYIVERLINEESAKFTIESQTKSGSGTLEDPTVINLEKLITGLGSDGNIDQASADNLRAWYQEVLNNKDNKDYLKAIPENVQDILSIAMSDNFAADAAIFRQKMVNVQQSNIEAQKNAQIGLRNEAVNRMAVGMNQLGKITTDKTGKPRIDAPTEFDLQEQYKNALIAEANTKAMNYVPLTPKVLGMNANGQESIDAFQNAIENMYPNMNRYWASNPELVLDPLNEARQKWFDTVYKMRMFTQSGGSNAEVAGLNQENAQINQRAENLVALSPDLQAMSSEWGNIAQAKTNLNESIAQHGERYSATEPEDPLKSFMKTFPFQERFLKLAPQARGYYSSKVKPPTTWRF